MDDRLHSEKEIKTLLPMAILSEIPEIVSPSDERSSKKKMAVGMGDGCTSCSHHPGRFCVQLSARLIFPNVQSHPTKAYLKRLRFGRSVSR